MLHSASRTSRARCAALAATAGDNIWLVAVKKAATGFGAVAKGSCDSAAGACSGDRSDACNTYVGI